MKRVTMRLQLQDDPELDFKEHCVDSFLLGFGFVVGGLTIVGLCLTVFGFWLIFI